MTKEDLAANYARAMYDIALAEWSTWLGAIQEHLVQDKTLAGLLADLSAEPAEKLKRMKRILPAGSSPKFEQFMAYLVDKGHTDLLDEIGHAFQLLVERGPAREVAIVTSAMPLTETERERLEEQLRQRFGAGLAFDYRVDKELLGGVRVRVGDTVIDGTIASRLEALRTQLSSR